jgi:hypothetical protein
MIDEIKKSVDVLSMDKVKRNIVEQIQDVLATVDPSILGGLKSYRGSYIDPANDRAVEYEVYFDRKYKVTADSTKNALYEIPVKIKSSDGTEREVFIETFENEAFLEERRRWMEGEMQKIKDKNK